MFSDISAYRKGTLLIFSGQEQDIEWQHKQDWGQLRWLGKEFSFLFNRRIISGIELIGDRVEALVKATNFWLFPCAIDAP